MAKNTLPPRAKVPVAPAVKRDIDFSILSDEKKVEIRKIAEAKVRARELLDAEDALLAKEMAAIEAKKWPVINHEMREIRLDLALYADCVKLDGFKYYHGELYTVPKPIYDVLMECQQSTWRHEQEIHGDPDAGFYRKNRSANTTLNWKTGAATSAPGPMRF